MAVCILLQSNAAAAAGSICQLNRSSTCCRPTKARRRFVVMQIKRTEFSCPESHDMPPVAATELFVTSTNTRNGTAAHKSNCPLPTRRNLTVRIGAPTCELTLRCSHMPKVRDTVSLSAYPPLCTGRNLLRVQFLK